MNEPNQNEPSDTALLDQQDQVVDDSNLCDRCRAEVDWTTTNWCLQCGYYPRYEGKDDRESPTVATQVLPWEAEASLKLPPWGIILIAGVVTLVGLSAYVGLHFQGNAYIRSVWTLSQIAFGIILLTVAQIAVYIHATINNGEKVGVFDWMLKPIAIWYSTIKALPHRAWTLWLMSWGITAVISAMALVGGVRYSAIFDDWGFTPTAAPNLVHQIVEQAREAEGGAENLEEAMNDFVGEGEPQEEEVQKNWVSVDCLIVGYTPMADNDFASLLLASSVKNKLTFIGTVDANSIPAEARNKLLVRMRQLESYRPIIKVPFAAMWVKPQLMCRVKQVDWVETQPTLKDAEFETLLKELPGK